MKGFTLIELVVSVAISLVVTGFIIVNYNSYNEIQTLKQAALTLKNNLRYAQSKASTGGKPTPTPPMVSPICTKLTGYTVSFVENAYSIQASCDPEGLVGEMRSIDLPSGVTFSPVPLPFSFPVLSRGTTLDTVTILQLIGSGKQYGIQVSPGGDISDVGLQ